MRIPRSAGVLLHPTSLPGPYGIGDIGPQAHSFVDWSASAGFRFWQVLPLGPTGFGNSPYQCHSVFAGNPNLISPELLPRDGLILPSEVILDRFPSGRARGDRTAVDFAQVIPWKQALLSAACTHFEQRAVPALKSEFDAFRHKNADWLDAFCLFMALKGRHAGASVLDWPATARSPERAVAARLHQELGAAVSQHAFSQWIFFRQWQHLRTYAHSRGVRIIGDAPIYAALDSADVWANPRLFCLDEEGRPTVVAGVPPDYFAPTGQLWGNPVYDWHQHKRTHYDWWIRRARSLLQAVDLVRLDHFRGFAGSWQIPASAPTAESGQWVPGPGEDLLDAIEQGIDGKSKHGHLPLIAEDLGVVTPDVARMLRAYDLPGMRVLQFGFTGYQQEFLPHNYPENSVAYTGTHDNDTSRGWFASASDAERRAALVYLKSSEYSIVRDMVLAIWRSAANLTVVPAQDILALGSEARMNFPGRAQGYWEWRLDPGALSESLALDFRSLSAAHDRLNSDQPDLS